MGRHGPSSEQVQRPPQKRVYLGSNPRAGTWYTCQTRPQTLPTESRVRPRGLIRLGRRPLKAEVTSSNLVGGILQTWSPWAVAPPRHAIGFEVGIDPITTAPSTSGLGRGPFKAEARVRISLGPLRETLRW